MESKGISREQAVPVSALVGYAPHRPPMIWIDTVVAASEEGGTCRVTLREGALYMGAEGLKALALPEFVAQAFLYWNGACQVRNGATPPKRAFLVAIRRASLALARPLGPDAVLDIRVDEISRIGAFTDFRGSVYCQGLLQAQMWLKVYSE